MKGIFTASLKTSFRTLVAQAGEMLAPNFTRAAKNFFVLSINVSGFEAGPLKSLDHTYMSLSIKFLSFSWFINIHPFLSMKSVISGHHRVLTQGLSRFLGRGLKVEPSVWGAQTPRVRVRRWNRTKPMTRLPLLPTSDPHPSPPWWTSARSSCPDPETENINNVKLPHPGSRRQSCINIWVFRKVRISSFHFDIYHLSSFRSVVVHATKDGVLIEMSWTFTFCKKQVVMSVRLKRGL